MAFTRLMATSAGGAVRISAGAGAPCRGFVVRRSLVDHGGTGCTGDRDKYTEGWSWLPLSRLNWTVPGAQRI